MAVESIDNKVAFGVVFDERGGMSKSVHGVPLEPGFVRVGVVGSIQDDPSVPVPVVGEIETVQQVISSHLAWPKDMIIYTSTTGSEKKKNAQNVSEVQRMHNAFNSVKPKDNVPPRFRLLNKFASTMMKESGNSISVPCDFQIFGIERTVYLLNENILKLLEFKLIGQSPISTYMGYLYSVFRDTPSRDLSAMFGSLHPSTYKLNDEFNEYVVQRLKDGVLRINFMPYNYKAVRSCNAQEGRVNKNPKVKNLVGCHKQPGGTECGYVVMRYMKDLIEDQEMKLLDKLVEE
ncbi:uncharacterized protein LOC141703572 [Apium graveolens]|uniref:uncharacterized protein LOC141703572 n=1 Tax=Apium graveolens TaxID=4045 RepID=UPI003D79C694